MATLYDLYGIDALNEPAAAPSASPSAVGGLKRSFVENKPLAAGVGAFVADAVGANSARDSMLAYAREQNDDIAKKYPSVSFSDVLEGKANAGDFLADAAGYVSGQALQALATGGLTAAGFRTLAKGAALEAAKGAAGKAAAAGAADEVAHQVGMNAARTVLERASLSDPAAQQVLRNAAMRGAAVGAGAHNLGMELGSIYPDAAEQAQKEGRELDGHDKLRAALSALAAAAVDTAMEGVTVGRLLKGTQGTSIMSRAAREVPAGMAREAVTEGIQTGIERYGAGKQIGGDEGLRDIVDSMAVGAVGGGLGGAASSLHRAPSPQSEAETSAAMSVPVESSLRRAPSPQQVADAGLNRLATATNVDEAIAGAYQVMSVPLTGISAAQEDRAMTAMEQQAQADLQQVRQSGIANEGRGIRSTAMPPAPAPEFEGSATISELEPFSDRVLTLREQVADAATRERVRALHPDALRSVLDVLGKVDRPDLNIPDANRDRLLAAAELIVSRAIAQPLASAEPGPTATRMPAGPGLGAPSRVSRIGLDTAPTGRIRVDSSGSAAPEVRADVISTKQRVDEMRRRPDGFEQQVQGRPLPRDFTLVGDGTLTTPTRPAPAAPRQISMDTALDERAHAAATSPTNDRPEPSQAQKDAGNYRLGHIRVAGLDISVENPAGSTRSGVDADGKRWQTRLVHHYGYIRATIGADGDHVDAFVKPGTPTDYAGPVFVVDQVDPKTGRWDEHKVVIGAADRAEAESIYRANYAADWQGMKAIKGMTMPAFKKWLAGDTTKPVGTLKDRVDAMRTPPAPAPADPNALPTDKLAELVELTGRDRATVAKQFTGFVDKHGREKANEMLDRALKVARERPKPTHAAATPQRAAVERDARGMTAEDRRLTKLFGAAEELSSQIQGDFAEDDFDADEVRPGLDLFARQSGVPAEELAQEVLKRLRGSSLKRGQIRKVEKALTPMPDPTPSVAAAPTPLPQSEPKGEPVAAAEAPAPAQAAEPAVPPAASPKASTANTSPPEAAVPVAVLQARQRQLRSLSDDLARGRSFTTALRSLGPRLEQADRIALLDRAAVLRRSERKTASEAARQAVDERLAEVRGQIVELDPAAAARFEAEASSAPEPVAGKIDDAGEKIGGARKDRWKERGLSVEDLDAMAEGEGATLANKANVWKPDYAAIAEQSEPVTAAMVKVVYDQLAAKPRKDTPEGRRDYVRAMQAVRKVYGAVRSVEEAKNAWRALRAELGVTDSNVSDADKAARRVLFSVYKGRTDPFVYGYNELSRAKKLVIDGFPGAVEPWTRRFVVRQQGGAGVTEAGMRIYSANAAAAGTPLTHEQISAGFFEVRDKAGRTQAYLATQADAEQAARALYEQTKAKDQKEAPTRPHLDKIVRDGLDQVIDRDVTAQDLLEAFGFRGVEWGNWSAQDERQRLLNFAYDALADLAKIMGVPQRALSLNGTLGMAFGARGGGNFAAHYEPGKLVINMTKLRGAGSLAHEWAHALDHYLGELARDDAYKAKARGASGWYERMVYERDQQKRLAYEPGTRKLVSVATPRLPNLRTELAESIDNVMRTLFGSGREPTKFVREAQALSGKSEDGYWTRPTEMWARAFESYVFDRLVAMGAKSEYLVHGVEQDRYADPARYKGNPYPTGEERAAINKAFDGFVAELKTREEGDGKVAMFSRAAPFVETVLQDGLPAFINAKAGIVLAYPQRTERFEVIEGEGEQVVNYAVMPADGFDVLGHVVVLLKDGHPASLIDIEVYGQRAGVGRKVIETLLAANPGADLTISNVVPAARGFWAKMGVPEQNVEGAYDGILNWQTYAAATGDGRAAGGDPKGSRAAGEERDTGAARADRGAAGEGETQGLSQAEAAAILALPQELINRLLGRRPTPERLRELVADAAPGLDVGVVQSVADLTPEQRKKLSAIEPGGNVRGVYFPDVDRVWLIADQLHSEAEASFVLLHEAFHRGLAKTIGGDAKRVLRQMYHTNGNLQRLAKQQMQAHGIGQDEAIEEALADLAGKGEARDLKGWQRLVEMVRDWLSDIGQRLGLTIEWTDDMIADFVAGTAQAGLRSGAHVNAAVAPIPSRSAMKDAEANIRRGERAMNLAINERADQHRAMFRAGIGWIDLVWGDARKGIQHIIEQRAAKDGMSRDEAVRMLTGTVVETIARGTEIRRRELGGSVRAVIALRDQEVVLVRNAGSNAWMLSGWKVSPGANVPANDSASATQPSADSSDTGSVAGDGESLPRLSRAGAAVDGPVAAQDLVNADGGVFDFNRLGSTRQDKIRTAVDGSRPFWLGALTRDQIADIYGKDIPAVKEYDTLTRAMENERSKIAQDADALYNDWAKLGSEVNDKLTRVMLDATVHSVHPDGEFTVIKGDDAATEAERRKMHKRLRREFAELPEDAQAMYRRVRDFHAGMLEQLRTGLEKRIERQVQDGKTRAATLTGIRESFDRYKEHGPYFPLSRFGDYLVIGTRADGERVVASYETAGEQATAARALQQDGFTVKMKTAKDYSRALDGSAGRFAGDVLTMLNDLDLSEATIGGKAADLKSQLMDDVNQLFIRALPDLSYRKHFAHRKNTPGFSSDMMRGFASSAFHAASHIARLNHADQMSFALEDAFKAIERVDEGDFNQQTQVLNELAKRHDASMNPNTHPIAAMLNQVGFVMYLGLSPAAGLIQLLQNPMITLPQLGAQYGFAKAAGAMTKASKDILGAKFNRQNGWNAADSQKLTETERATMRKLQDEGVIDLTQAHDLAAATGLDTGSVARSKAAFAMSRVMKIVGWTFHVPEVMNRQIAALTAYRLEMAKSNDQAKAEDAARDSIKRTHFDYSSSNRARYMQGNVARVALQFKQYAQNMSYLLGRAAYLALKGESEEVRTIARRQLVATLGATFVMAGALGLPGIGAAMGLIGVFISAMADDDKPWDWKVWLRNLLADALGKEVGEVIAHGVPRALMPWDLSNRVGMGDLWFRSNDRQGQSARDAFATDMTNILGPSAGTLLGLYTASDHMARGNWSKAVESMVPKAIRDPLQAVRIATEGITSYNGEHLMDVTAAESIGRALGFSPARAAEMYESANAVKNAETAVMEKRKLLISRAARARMEGDTETGASVADEIRDFNRRNPGELIKGESIIASVLAHRRHERQTIDGAYLPANRDHFREAARFAVTE